MNIHRTFDLSSSVIRAALPSRGESAKIESDTAETVYVTRGRSGRITVEDDAGDIHGPFALETDAVTCILNILS